MEKYESVLYSLGISEKQIMTQNDKYSRLISAYTTLI